MSLPKRIEEIDVSRSSWSLKLLSRMHAPFLLAVFAEAFDFSGSPIEADVLHEKMLAAANQAHAFHVKTPFPEDKPVEMKDVITYVNSINVVNHTEHDPWLLRRHDKAKNIFTYGLTPEALGARSIMESIEVEPTRLSESSLKRILDTIDNAAMLASDKTEVQLSILDAKIAELQAQRQRIADHEMPSAAHTEEGIASAYVAINDLIRNFPTEFRTLSEEITAMRPGLIAKFRERSTSQGKIIRDHHETFAKKMAESSNGRAYEGVMAMINDDALMSDIEEKLALIVDHPSMLHLRQTERTRFKTLTSMLTKGISDVRDAKTSTQSIITRYVARLDAMHESDLLDALDDLEESIASVIAHKNMKFLVDTEGTPIDYVSGQKVATSFHDLIPPEPMVIAVETIDTEPPVVKLNTFIDMDDVFSKIASPTTPEPTTTLTASEVVMLKTASTEKTPELIEMSLSTFLERFVAHKRTVKNVTSMIDHLDHIDSAIHHDDTEIIELFNVDAENVVTSARFIAPLITWSEHV